MYRADAPNNNLLRDLIESLLFMMVRPERTCTLCNAARTTSGVVVYAHVNRHPLPKLQKLSVQS